MTDRERLIKLLSDVEKNPDITCPNPKNVGACRICKHKINDVLCDGISREADYLLEHGVIVLLCKIGDNVYRTGDPIKKVYEFSVTCIEIFEDEVVFIDDSDNEFTEHDIGKTVFLTREEAEQALKERDGA